MSDDLLGRYRRVYVRIWDDPKFRKLSPDAQRVALYLLSGPQTNRIGLFKVSMPRAADDLNLEIEIARQAVTAVCVAFEWRFDADARVIYLPNWWRWNTSVNTNILIGNLKDLGEIPICGLVEAFVSNLVHVPPKLRQSFRKALGKFSQIFKEASGNIRQPQDQDQKQEQKQDQDQKHTHTASTGGADARGHLPESLLEESENVLEKSIAQRSQAHNGNGTGLLERFDAFWAAYPNKVGKKAAWLAWQNCRPGQELTLEILAALAWQRQQGQWLLEGGRFVPHPATWLNRGQWQDEPSKTPRVSSRNLATIRAGQEFEEP